MTEPAQPRRRIRVPLLVAGVVVAIVALRYMLIPGIWLVSEVTSIDASIVARDARLLPIDGRIASIAVSEGFEQHRDHELYLATTIVYGATPPGATKPALTSSDVYGKYPIAHHGEVPANLPHVGDPHPLWYDPQDPNYVTFYAPGGSKASVGIVAWILVGIGGVLTALAIAMIGWSVRRRTPS